MYSIVDIYPLRVRYNFVSACARFHGGTHLFELFISPRRSGRHVMFELAKVSPHPAGDARAFPKWIKQVLVENPKPLETTEAA